MSDVFNLIFNLFSYVISFMRRIPLSDNVSLFDFSVALFIMSITIIAFVPLVRVGSSNVSRRSSKSKSSDDK